VRVDPRREAREFLGAALVRPVAPEHDQSPQALRRRRVVAAVTLVAGAVVLFVALRIPPGDAAFYPATFGLAVVWAAGGFLSGPLHLGRAHTRAGSTYARPVIQSLALGAVLLGTFLAGAFVVGRVPGLRDPVVDLLDHARVGSLPLVAVITVVNGIAEEIYFRGALYPALRRHGVLVTTIVYVVAMSASGIALLAFAAAVIGLVTALQRRVTGGILGPIVTHVTWSLGMLFLLRPALDAFR
jgi:membrane protease YdiL (CAAX protease family)